MEQMTDSIPKYEQCAVKDCSHRWSNLCRICSQQICADHTTIIIDPEIPRERRCPSCARLSTAQVITVLLSSEARQHREAFWGRILLRIREATSSENWQAVEEFIHAQGIEPDQAIRTAIHAMRAA